MYSNQISTTSLKGFNVLQKLGEGSFASVYKVERVDDKRIYAMKKVKIGQMKQRERDNALNQVRVLASISHPNIINYKEAFFDDQTQSLCIVMQFADAGDIQKKINQHIKNHTHFNELQIWQALIQMTKGLKALHQINILHRDLKCANVFCAKDNKYKLGDLNVSKVAKKGMARTQTGTPYYTSPQVWKDRPYDSKCDIWSLGCVIYEMASLNPPFRASNLKQLYSKIQRGIFQRIPSFYSDDLAEIINLCLKVNPMHRPSAVQILQHPKIATNTPQSQKYAMNNDQTKKINLINTILCPKNLKSLKMALPGAKYEQQSYEVNINKNRRPGSVEINRNDSGSHRSLSSKNNSNVLRPINQLPKALNSPQKVQIISREYEQVVQRRPSERNILPIFIKRNPSFQERSKQKQRERQRQRQRQRERERQRERQRERSKQRERERESLKQKQRPYIRPINRNNSKLVRNYSADILKKRRESSRSLENNSYKKEEKMQKKQVYVKNNNYFMEDISNRCKNIKQRVQMLMANRQKQKYEEYKNDYKKRYLIALPNSRNSNSRQKRQGSQRSINSIEKKVHMINANSKDKKYGYVAESQRISNNRNGNSSKSLNKNNSSERLQRQNSRKMLELRNHVESPYRR